MNTTVVKLQNINFKDTLLKLIQVTIFFSMLLPMSSVWAEEYTIDNGGAHSSIQFKISHLGYSWLWGRFNNLKGKFSYDEKNPSNSNVVVTVNANSIDTNHAELNKHLRSNDFLDARKYPEIKFVSTQYIEKNGEGKLQGKLSLHGITKLIEVDITPVGSGDDPWGGYRRGFEGTFHIKLADFGITKDLGPASAELQLFIALEGIRQ